MDPRVGSQLGVEAGAKHISLLDCNDIANLITSADLVPTCRCLSDPTRQLAHDFDRGTHGQPGAIVLCRLGRGNHRLSDLLLVRLDSINIGQDFLHHGRSDEDALERLWGC